MLIPQIAIRRPVMAVMLTMAMVVFGLIANVAIGVSLFPDVDFPIVTVTTVLPGAAPDTVETEISERVEEAVSTLPGIKNLRSISAESISQVFVEFETGTDVDIAAQDVRDKVETVRRDLVDAGADPPTVEKLNLDAEPIVAVVIRGPGSIAEVTAFAEDVRERLQQVDGVGSVTRVGGQEREVRIWLDADRLESRRIPVLSVVEAVQRENTEIPGGRLERVRNGEAEELVVKTRSRLRTIDQFNDIVIAWRDGAPVRLRDIGRARDGLEDRRTVSTLTIAGEEGAGVSQAVSLLVQRRSGTNVVEVAERVREEVAAIGGEHAQEGYRLVITNDQSHFVEISIDAVKEDVVLGAIFTVIIILLFLHNIRLTFVAAVVIPASLLATIFTIWLLGFTLNNLSMLAISIAVGIVVDDAIVMLENIHRHIEMGKTRARAALDGASEIGFAIIAVSFSLMAVFVPVAFMSGLVGQFFYEFGLTVAAAIFWSLVLSLTLTPMMCSRMVATTHRDGMLSRGINGVLDWLDRRYRGVLRFVLRARLLTLALSGAILVVSFIAAGMFVQFEFVPAEDRGEFTVNVQIDAQRGAAPDLTAERAAAVEAIVRENPAVSVTFTSVGGGSQGQVNQASIYVGLVNYADRVRQEEVMRQVREALAGKLPDDTSATVSNVLGVSGGGFRSQQVQLVLAGPDLEKLDAMATRITSVMEDTPGFVDVDTTYESGKPEIGVRPDRDRAASFGIRADAVAQTVNAAIGGVEAGTWTDAGERYTVRIRLEEDDRQSLDDVLALTVPSATGEPVRMTNLAQVDRAEGAVSIERLARSRTVTVLANLGEKADGQMMALGEAVQVLTGIITGELDGEVTYSEGGQAQRFALPDGYTARMVGFAEMMGESMQSIFFTMALSLIVIYMALASQFDSYVHPFTIMMSVPLAVAGALLALAAGQYNVSIITLIGFLMLFGLVTKNAIILIDFINQLRREGKERDDAILTAGPLRLRPILMTAVSTVAGMVPVAFFGSEGSEVRSPLAISVIGGMILSTGLTLLVIPVVYTLLDDIARNPVARAIGRMISPTDHREGGSTAPAVAVASQAAIAMPTADPRPPTDKHGGGNGNSGNGGDPPDAAPGTLRP